MKIKDMAVGDSKTMNDGTTAYLSSSRNYFIRREPRVDDFHTIRYYTLRGREIKLATGVCNDCNETIGSKMCGDFQRCPCGKSYVDTDRWMPERHRFGGNIRSV